ASGARAGREHARALTPAEHGARMRRRGARAGEALAQRGEVLAGVDVQEQRGQALDPPARFRGPRERAVAGGAAGPEARSDRVRRGEKQAVGAGPVTIGHDHHLGLRGAAALAAAAALALAAAAARAQQALELAGVERGTVAGDA